MKKFLLILPLALTTQLVLAQTTPIPTGTDAEQNLEALGNGNRASSVRVFDNRYAGVKGTPYFNNSWGKASVTINNKVFKNVEVKYNVYDNMVLYKNPKGVAYELSAALVDKLELQDSLTQHTYLFKQYPALSTIESSLGRQLAQVVYEGPEVQLVLVPEKKFMKASFKGGYSAGQKYDEFQDGETYYMIGPGKAMDKVRLNKRNLLKALPDKQEQIEDYLDGENIDAGAAEGWAEALAYYESL